MPRVIPAGNKTDPWELMKLHITETNRDTSQMRRQRVEGEQLTQRLDSAAQMQGERLKHQDARADMMEAGRDRRHSERMAARGATNVGKLTNTKATDIFLNTLRENGYNNPVALAAVAASIQSESGGRPNAYNPDDKGMPSGYMLQWRDDRLRGIESFAKRNDMDVNDPRTQALWFIEEGKTSERGGHAKLLNAKTPEEANQAMYGIQRFDNSKGELNNRLALTRSYASKYAGMPKPTKSELAANEHSQRIAGTVGEQGVTEEPGVYKDEKGRRFQVANYKADDYIKTRRNIARQFKDDPRGVAAADDYVVLDRKLPLDAKGNLGYRVYLDAPIVDSNIANAGGAPTAGSQLVSAPNEDVKLNLPGATANALPSAMPNDIDEEEDDDNEGF